MLFYFSYLCWKEKVKVKKTRLNLKLYIFVDFLCKNKSNCQDFEMTFFNITNFFSLVIISWKLFSMGFTSLRELNSPITNKYEAILSSLVLHGCANGNLATILSESGNNFVRIWQLICMIWRFIWLFWLGHIMFIMGMVIFHTKVPTGKVSLILKKS